MTTMEMTVSENGNGIHIDEQAVLRALKLDPRDVHAQAVLLVCQRYGLDPILRHMLLIEGRPYITRDGLLHVAHRSGQLDGIEVLEEGANGGEWTAKVAVYRKDMSRPFAYTGRYSGTNKKYGPEMAIKTAEVMALRRAFDVTGIPVMEEQADKWDSTVDAETGEIIERRAVTAPPVQGWSEAEVTGYRSQTAAEATRDAWRWFAVQVPKHGCGDHAAVCQRLGVASLKADLGGEALGAILDRLAAPAGATDEPPIEGEARVIPPEEAQAPGQGSDPGPKDQSAPASARSRAAAKPSSDAWREVVYDDAQADKGAHVAALSAFQKAVRGQGPLPTDCGGWTLGEIADAMTGGGQPPAEDAYQPSEQEIDFFGSRDKAVAAHQREQAQATPPAVPA